MSILGSYIKLLPKVIKNLNHVIAGITNDLRLQVGFLSKEDEETIVGRRLVCSTCPFNSKNAKAAGWYASDRPDEHCTHCECNLDFKTADLTSSCGIEAYNQKNPNSPLELKWTKVK